MSWLLLLATAAAVDLEATRAAAVEQAIAVEQAAARAAAAQGATWEAVGTQLPQVDLFASASQGAGLTSFGFERPVSQQAAAGVQATWQLLDPAGWAATEAARHTARGQRALLDWARVDARRDATLAVAELWTAQQQADAWRAAVDDAREALDAVQGRVDAGLRAPADAARARATLARLEALAAEAEGAVAGRCARVRALVREPVDRACDPAVVDGATEGEVPQGPHPALVAADEVLRATRARRSGTLLERVPSLAATGTAAHYVAGDASGFGWSTGLEARMPLVSSGAGIGRARQARADVDDATLAYEAQERELAAATIDATARHAAAGLRVEAEARALDAAEEALRLVQARYDQGLDGLEAWLIARRTRDEARASLAQARGARLAVLAELESLQGVW